MKTATSITSFPHGAIALPPLVDRAAHRTAPVVAPPSRLRDFYELTKPRMNALVVVTTGVGFYLAAPRLAAINWPLFLHTILGTILTAAGASVLNQYIER